MRKPRCLNRIEGTRNAICFNRTLPSFKMKVDLKTCQRCPESSRLVRLPQRGNDLVQSASVIPPETPQKTHTEPPEITPLGTLIYARTGWEPPPCPPGYQRRSSDLTSDDAWILDPIDTVCKHLKLVPVEIGSCGYRRVGKKCLLIDSFIGQRTCQTCAKREPIDAG